jgi:hypothetical protein
MYGDFFAPYESIEKMKDINRINFTFSIIKNNNINFLIENTKNTKFINDLIEDHDARIFSNINLNYEQAINCLNKEIDFRFVSEKLISNKKFMLEAVCRYKSMFPFCVFQYASEELKSDKELALVAIKNDSYCVKYFSEKLLSNKNFMIQAVKTNRLILKYYDGKFIKDKDFMERIKKIAK